MIYYCVMTFFYRLNVNICGLSVECFCWAVALKCIILRLKTISKGILRLDLRDKVLDFSWLVWSDPPLICKVI